jgi:hypothetical protein
MPERKGRTIIGELEPKAGSAVGLLVVGVVLGLLLAATVAALKTSE